MTIWNGDQAAIGSSRVTVFHPRTLNSKPRTHTLSPKSESSDFTTNPFPYYHFWRCTKGLTLRVSESFIGVPHHYLVLGDLNRGRERFSNSSDTFSFPSSLRTLCSDRVSSKIQNDQINFGHYLQENLKPSSDDPVSLKSEHWLFLEVRNMSDLYYFFIFFLVISSCPLISIYHFYNFFKKLLIFQRKIGR